MNFHIMFAYCMRISYKTNVACKLYIIDRKDGLFNENLLLHNMFPDNSLNENFPQNLLFLIKRPSLFPENMFKEKFYKDISSPENLLIDTWLKFQ